MLARAGSEVGRVRAESDQIRMRRWRLWLGTKSFVWRTWHRGRTSIVAAVQPPLDARPVVGDTRAQAHGGFLTSSEIGHLKKVGTVMYRSSLPIFPRERVIINREIQGERETEIDIERE